MNRWLTRWWVWAIPIAVLFGAGYAGFSYYNKPSFDKYAPVLAAMAVHHVDVDEAGRVDMAKDFPGVTGKNDAYITWRPDTSYVVMFPTYYGEGSQIIGLMYSSRPLQDSDIHYRDGVITFTRKMISVGSFSQLAIDKKLNENWYIVSYKMH